MATYTAEEVRGMATALDNRAYRPDSNGEPMCDELDARSANALAAFADLLEQREWRPIEDAPRDGTVIVVTNDAQTYAAAWKAKDPQFPWVILDMDGEPNELTNTGMNAPTRWRPLVADANPAEDWQLMRDAAPTIDAVPVEELRELAERLLYTAEHADTRGYGPRQTARGCVGCIRALIAKHSR